MGMTPAPLARVADPAELAQAKGPRARLRVTIPASWLEQDVSLQIQAPKLLRCTACGGGGCDQCGRSGALQAPAAQAERVLRVSLAARCKLPCAVRLAEPFPGSAIEQLLVQLEPGERASDNVCRVQRRAAQLVWRRQPIAPILLGLALMVMAVVIVMLVWR